MYNINRNSKRHRRALMKKFECNSCSYKFWIESPKKKYPWCPNCRAGVYEADYPLPDNAAEFTCGECKSVFSTPADQIYPYKCPCCNFTIPDTPGRDVKHKL